MDIDAAGTVPQQPQKNHNEGPWGVSVEGIKYRWALKTQI